MKSIRGLCASLRGAFFTRRFGKPDSVGGRRARAAGLLAMVPIMLVGQAQAEVALRVEARPIGDPIRAYVTVTDAGGNPVGGLGQADFTVAVDGTNIATPPVQQPPVNDPGQHVSVVFAMDYSFSVQTAARAAMEQAVTEFIESMAVGDYAAIVKFNGKNGASVVQPFTAINGTGNTALLAAVSTDYPGSGTNLFDAVITATAQFTSPPVGLPAGPKAIILISDGGENESTADINEAVGDANDAGIAIFTIGVGDFSPPNAQSILNALADQTGGDFYPAPTEPEIGDAYVAISQLLNNEYLLSFVSAIADCDEHTLTVTVAGQAAPANATFTRCTPVLAPDVRGHTEAEANAILLAQGLGLGTVTTSNSNVVAAGLVITQTPTVGTAVAPASTVNIVVSLGPVQVQVPNVVGQSQSAATTALTNAHLAVGTVTQQNSTTVAAGSVISQSPAAGTTVNENSAVNLVVSSGPPQVPVPNVVGQSQSAASTAITGAGLAVGTVTQQSSSTVASGNVISQTPAAGSSVNTGTAVNLVVSSGKPPSSGGGGGASGPFMVLGLMLLGLVRNLRRRA
jgi:VWFA-related protein